MKLLLVGAALLAGTGTAAAATFDEVSDTIERRPATQLVEQSCDVDIDLRGALATVEVRQRIANPGTAAMAGVLELPLPAGAQVVGFAADGDSAMVVSGTAPPKSVSDEDVLGADPAVLERDGDAAAYRIRMQPILPEHTLALTTRYTFVAPIAGGAVKFALPGRDAAGKLTVCRTSLRATPGPGATVKSIHVGATTTAGRNATFSVDRIDVPVAVVLDVAGTVPIVWTQTQAIAPGFEAALVTVIGPPGKPTGARRVVFVVDGSKSMELVGKGNVVAAIDHLAAGLPADSEVEAVIYDRTATRVLNAVAPLTPATLKQIESAVTAHVAANGSDLVGAFQAVAPLVETARGTTMVVLITDGVIGDQDSTALSRALGAKFSAVDLQAILLDPATTESPGADVVRGPVELYGGSFVELRAEQLDHQLDQLDESLRPAWVDLALGDIEVPGEVRAGSGFTQLVVRATGTLGALTLTGHADAPFRVKPKALGAPPVETLAPLAMAMADEETFALAAASGKATPTEAQLQKARKGFERARVVHAVAGPERSFAVLTTTGRIAKSRRAVVAGGGDYERMIWVDERVVRDAVTTAAPGPMASAIAKETLARLFRDQLQPKAYACYVRALGTDQTLAGTVQFTLRLGRGEVSEASVSGLGNAALDACLLDAAYGLAPPFPDFSVNADDQTIANYPLTFQRHEEKVIVILGDADSTSPIDFEALKTGVPTKRGPVNPNTTTPLGDLRPTKTP